MFCVSLVELNQGMLAHKKYISNLMEIIGAEKLYRNI